MAIAGVAAGAEDETMIGIDEADSGSAFYAPVGMREADAMQASMEAVGRRISALHKAGRCAHGWAGPAPSGGIRCMHERCGASWPTESAWWAEHRRLIGRPV